MKNNAIKILNNYFGFPNFREGQNKIIDAILEKKDVLGIMTTGAGKSVCYQIPALLFDGLTIVISPLISLMKDQVDSLKILGINAEYINSSLDEQNINSIFFKISTKKIKILYISPERIENKQFFNFIRKNAEVSMVVVDEAHCISQWGDNFRKSYLKISNFIDNIDIHSRRILRLAFTATATSAVKKDIVNFLKMKKPFIYSDYFDRPNIYFSVINNLKNSLLENKDEKIFIAEYLKKNSEKSGIIYCSTRKNVENIFNYVKNSLNLNVVKYHAGLTKEEREKNQELFIKDDINIMVATNAFGMGINKSNIRFIIHANIPSNLENYYQEAGRAGRDGLAAEAILIYNAHDISTQNFLITKEDNNPKKIKENLKKFEKMKKYAETDECYREYILKYFGEKFIRNYCGFCDNCAKEKNIKDYSLEAQKIFSCIGRTGENLGISTLVNTLVGRADSKMITKNLDKISTFGIMKDFSMEWIESFINYLISEKFLIQGAGSFPIIKLTDKARDVLKNEIKIIRKIDEKIDFDYFENKLFRELNSLRKKIAKSEDVAPYIIFSDMTLIEMSEKIPKTRWEMLKIKGVGNQKFKKYGNIFLNCIMNFRQED